MPIATPEVYAQMLDAAKDKSFAYPAINVSSSQTLNAALKGFADAGSDGIIQISTGGAEYLSGPSVKDMVTGSVAFAAYAEAPDARFAIHAGDLVNWGSRDFEWAEWFRSVGFIHGMIPAVPACPGKVPTAGSRCRRCAMSR